MSTITLGVYKIENKLNNKVYIGESNDIERRWLEHIEELNNNSHHSYKLQNDWNTYGEENFTFKILEEIEKIKGSSYKTNMQLIYVEGKYIDQYDSITNGYNIENTIEEILNGKKVIVREKMDKGYLRNLIKNNGIPNDKSKKKKSKAKSKAKVNSNEKNCIMIYKELLNEGYIMNFSTSIHSILESVEIFYKENNSFYVNDKYLKDNYFINGKEQINNNGYKYYQILVTPKGKQFIIDTLKLKNNKVE